MPTRDPKVVNEFNPGNKAISELAFTGNRNWIGGTQPNTLNERRLLSYAVTLSYRSPTRARVYVKHNITQCYLDYMNMYTNAEGVPLEDVHVFAEWKPPCNHSALNPVIAQIKSLINTMQATDDYDELRLLHVKINFLALSDEYVGCLAFLQQFIKEATVTLTRAESTCQSVRSTPEYLSDPCCYGRAAMHHCCTPAPLEMKRKISADLQVSNMSEQCGVSMCAERSVRAFAALTKSDADGACSVASSNASLRFVTTCRTSILGAYDMDGIPCTTDAQCSYGATCNFATSRCNHNESHVVRCWAEALADAPAIAASLFNEWALPEKATVDRLIMEITARITRIECTGEGALDFRYVCRSCMPVCLSLYFSDHYRFAPDVSSCYDSCLNPSAGIDLEPRCFEVDEETCKIPAICNRDFTDSLLVCWRGWVGCPRGSPSLLTSCSASFRARHSAASVRRRSTVTGSTARLSATTRPHVRQSARKDRPTLVYNAMDDRASRRT